MKVFGQDCFMIKGLYMLLLIFCVSIYSANQIFPYYYEYFDCLLGYGSILPTELSLQKQISIQKNNFMLIRIFWFLNYLQERFIWISPNA